MNGGTSVLYPVHCFNTGVQIKVSLHLFGANYNMTLWILVRNGINFSIAAALIRLYMPGVK